MAPESPQKMTKAASASQTSGVNRFWEKITAAKTKRFFTHWRGRSETTAARKRFTSRPRALARKLGGGLDGPLRGLPQRCAGGAGARTSMRSQELFLRQAPRAGGQTGAVST